MKKELPTHNDCTGCMACFAVCSVSAISVIKDNNGFVYPQIEEKSCVNCGRCTTVCPIINLNKLNWQTPQKSYAAKITNSQLVRGCTSGGITTAIVENTINKGGVVYGSSYVPHEGTKHIRISTLDEIDKLKGSKYVESYTSEIFDELKKDVRSGGRVLFIGTPCQVAAIEQIYNPDKHPNIRTISFICGGVPSHAYLESHLRSNGINPELVDNVVFRKGRSYCVETQTNGRVTFNQPQKDNLYLYAFDNEGYSVRPSCLRCNFCRKERVGDITVGDFWGIEYSQYKIKKEKDLSCVLTHNAKGELELKQLDSLLKENVDYADINSYNICLRDHRAVGNWLYKEYLLHLFFPIIGFNSVVKTISLIAKIHKLPKRIIRKLCRIYKDLIWRQ